MSKVKWSKQEDKTSSFKRLKRLQNCSTDQNLHFLSDLNLITWTSLQFLSFPNLAQKVERFFSPRFNFKGKNKPLIQHSKYLNSFHLVNKVAIPKLFKWSKVWKDLKIVLISWSILQKNLSLEKWEFWSLKFPVLNNFPIEQVLNNLKKVHYFLYDLDFSSLASFSYFNQCNSAQKWSQ